MAGLRGTSTGNPATSPRGELDVADPSMSQADAFTLRAILDLTRSQGTFAAEINNLGGAIERVERTLERVERKVDKIDDVRVAVASLETRMTSVTADIATVKSRLDGVRTWVVGAGAVVAVVVAITPVALRFWPPPPVVAVAAPQAQPW